MFPIRLYPRLLHGIPQLVLLSTLEVLVMPHANVTSGSNVLKEHSW